MRYNHTIHFAGLLAIGFAKPLFAHENDAHERVAVLTSYFADGAVIGEPSIIDCTLNCSDVSCDATNPIEITGPGVREHD